MSPYDTPDAHAHDFGAAACACGVLANKQIALWRETLAEQVAFVQKLLAERDLRGVDDGLVKP